MTVVDWGIAGCLGVFFHLNSNCHHPFPLSRVIAPLATCIKTSAAAAAAAIVLAPAAATQQQHLLCSARAVRELNVWGTRTHGLH